MSQRGQDQPQKIHANRRQSATPDDDMRDERRVVFVDTGGGDANDGGVSTSERRGGGGKAGGTKRKAASTTSGNSASHVSGTTTTLAPFKHRVSADPQVSSERRRFALRFETGECASRPGVRLRWVRLEDSDAGDWAKARARVIGFDSKMSRSCEDGGKRRRGGMSC